MQTNDPLEAESKSVEQYLPVNMTSKKRSTTSSLRRLERARRIVVGKRPKKRTLYGKRWATICKKRKLRQEIG